MWICKDITVWIYLMAGCTHSVIESCFQRKSIAFAVVWWSCPVSIQVYIALWIFISSGMVIIHNAHRFTENHLHATKSLEYCWMIATVALHMYTNCGELCYPLPVFVWMHGIIRGLPLLFWCRNNHNTIQNYICCPLLHPCWAAPQLIHVANLTFLFYHQTSYKCEINGGVR